MESHVWSSDSLQVHAVHAIPVKHDEQTGKVVGEVVGERSGF